ncbi:MAG: fibronectin type III domain-containing protein, partial [Salinispira sp.]
MMFTCNPLRKVRGSSFVLVVISFVLAALLVGCPTPGDDTPTPPDPVDTVTPPDTMAAPTLEAGNRHLLVAWSAPADNGGSEITAYELRHSDDGGNTWSGLIEIPAPATETIITGLTNLTPYTVQARARNSAGAGDWSESSAEATPIVVSLAPTAFTLTAEDTIITATWAAPTDTGGSAIIRYELQHREVGAAEWEAAVSITVNADPTYT